MSYANKELVFLTQQLHYKAKDEKKKFEKYTVDPNQKRGRPRKEKGKPQTETENLDEKYLKESLLEYSYNKDKYARADIERRFRKLHPNNKEHMNPNDIEKFMGWNLDEEKTEYAKEREEFYAQQEKDYAEAETLKETKESAEDFDNSLSELKEMKENLNDELNELSGIEKVPTQKDVLDKYIDGLETIFNSEIQKVKTELGRDLSQYEEQAVLDNFFAKLKNRISTKSEEEIYLKIKLHFNSLKSNQTNTKGEMHSNYSQEGSPPQEGEYAIGQVMKVLASLEQRLTQIEQMKMAQPVQPPQQLEQPAQQIPPQAGQLQQTPVQGEQIPAQGGEIPPQQGGEENPFAEEGAEEEIGRASCRDSV